MRKRVATFALAEVMVWAVVAAIFCFTQNIPLLVALRAGMCAWTCWGWERW